MPKNVKGGSLRFFNNHSVAKFQQKIEGEPIRVFEKFFEKKQTSRERPKSAPYPRLKNSKKTSKCQVFSFTVLENQKFFEKKWTEWRAKVSQCRKTERGTL